jgi:arsenate reductase
LAVAEELGVDHEVILYIKTPPGRGDLEKIVKALEDPVEDLVRKDSKFKKLELVPEDYVDNAEAVVEILIKHKQLLQRPVLLRGNKAIIGRPKQRIIDFLSTGA